jgi:hypothetical protein
MPLFRKKPVVISAEQYIPGKCVPDGLTATFPGSMDGPLPADAMWCPTLEGGHIASPGDWIITGVKGEKYPCKPDIFEATYESAEPATVGDSSAGRNRGGRQVGSLMPEAEATSK